MGYKGQIPWNKGLKGYGTFNQGKKRTEEQNKANSLRNQGRTPWNKGKKMPEGMVGKMLETRKERGIHVIPKSVFKKGQKPYNYIDGRSKNLGPARYGDDWDAIRYVVYSRDKFTCQDCGVNGLRLDVHHKIPYLYSGDNSIENLITLCRKCHMIEEQRIRKEFKQNKTKIEIKMR